MVLLYMGAGGNARDEVFGTFLQKMETDFVNPVSCGKASIHAIILETEKQKSVSFEKIVKSEGRDKTECSRGMKKSRRN